MTATDLANTILGAQPAAMTSPGPSIPAAAQGQGMPTPPDATVRDYLAQATAAHLRYRRALADNVKDPTVLVALLNEAAVLRAQAEVLDPDHTDTAWLDNGGTHPDGVTTHGAINLDLLQFYVQQLGLEA